jgi:hypothetical protein
MKKLLFLIVLLFTTALTFAQDVYVQGYYRSNGTYVQGHYRTRPDYTRDNNYGTVGNTNPYTGKAGTQPRYGYTSTRTTYSNYSAATYRTTYSNYSEPTYRNTTTYSAPAYRSTYTPTYTAPTTTYSTPSYSSTQTIYTGPRGGTYYINSNGNKSYVN